MSLCHAVQRYASLTGTSYRSVFTELANRCAPKVAFRNDSRALTAAAAELEHARRVYLEGLRAFAAQRRIEKRSGTGKSQPSDLAAAGLRAAITLGLPLAELIQPPVSQMVSSVVAELEQRPTTSLYD